MVTDLTQFLVVNSHRMIQTAVHWFPKIKIMYNAVQMPA